MPGHFRICPPVFLVTSQSLHESVSLPITLLSVGGHEIPCSVWQWSPNLAIFMEDNCSMEQGRREWFGDDSSPLHLWRIFFLLLLHQLIFRHSILEVGNPCSMGKRRVGSKGLLSQEKLSPSCHLRLEGHSNQEDVWMQCRIPAAPSDCLHEKWGPTRSQKRSQALHKLEVWCGSAKVKGREGAMHVLFCPFSWLAPSRMSSL